MSLLLLTAIVLVAALLAAAVMHLVRRRLPDEGAILRDRDLGSTSFAFVGTAFAVLVAFVIVEAYDSFNDARGGVEGEAIAVVELARTADLFQEEDRDRANGLLVCYGRAVINDEWPLMEEGEEGSDLVTEWGWQVP